MAESEAECFSGVKTAQNNKTEGGTETNKKKIKMWSWGKKMCLGRSHIEKNQRNAPWNSCRDGFFAVEPKQPERKEKQLNTSCLWYCIKCQTRGVSEVICAQRHTTNCTSRHNSKWLLDLTPPHPEQSHKCWSAWFGSQIISSEVSYWCIISVSPRFFRFVS